MSYANWQKSYKHKMLFYSFHNKAKLENEEINLFKTSAAKTHKSNSLIKFIETFTAWNIELNLK